MTLSTIETAHEDSDCRILEIGLCLDCVDAGECFAERPVMPLDPACAGSEVQDTIDPRTPWGIPLYDQLLALADQHDALIRAGWETDARATKEQACCLVEQWFDDHEARYLSGAEELEQITAARAHVSATLARWQFEQQEGAPF
jgi:hypothetical protein